ARARPQADDRRAGASALGRRVGVAGDERMPGEHSLHDLPLDADPSTVDQAHLDEPFGLRGVKVLGDDRRHVAWREGVKVQRILDRDADRLVDYSRGPPSTCSFQWSNVRRSSPESLHCQKVAARSKKVTSTTPTFSARAVSATFSATIWRTNGIGIRPSRWRTSSVQRIRVPGRTGPSATTASASRSGCSHVSGTSCCSRRDTYSVTQAWIPRRASSTLGAARSSLSLTAARSCSRRPSLDSSAASRASTLASLSESSES